MKELQWKLVWITGGGTGIGRSTALSLSESGARVIISGRTENALKAVADESVAQHHSGSVIPLVLDMTDQVAVGQAVELIEAEYGKLDLALLCAGNHQSMPVDRFSATTCRELMEVNYFGVMNALDALLPRMLARDSGVLGVVASVAGYRGLPTAAAYGGSKAALINACEALATELRGTGVHLSLINPGFVRTPLTDKNSFPMPFLIEADDAASAILKGLQRKRFEIAFPWTFVLQLKIMRLLPYFIYLPLIRKVTGADAK
ncbi:SDR family NAD(P)-dependent oxidoreductase [Nitrincola sp. MINF-07-Sa-05]|uniref:SDR family NAD(P)-dependent oxidoreductase n=1 Tax=Nitrincola salilacus TaxID=3400273 RepID=UPI0039180662